MFVQTFLAIIKEGCEKNPLKWENSEAMVRSWKDGEKPAATSTRTLSIMLLWMCGRVQEKRREKTRVTLEKETAEEARGSWIKSCSEGKAEEGWLEKFLGRKVCSKGAGAQSWLHCFQGGRGAGVRTGKWIARKSAYCPVFSVSKKKLKTLKIKHCILQWVCKAVGREQKRGHRRQRERCFTAQNREGNDCQGAWKSSGKEGNTEKEDLRKLSVLPLGGGMMLGGEEREKSQALREANREKCQSGRRDERGEAITGERLESGWGHSAKRW